LAEDIKIWLNKQKMTQKKFEEIKKWYSEEILKRDKIIDDLKKENMLLLRTAIKKRDEELENNKGIKK
jgi:hypothetical protein